MTAAAARERSSPADHRRLRQWTLGICAVWLAWSIAAYFPPLAPDRWPKSWRLFVIVFVATGQSVLFFSAARRAELGRRLQQALRLLAVAMLLVAISDALVALMDLDTTGPPLLRVNDLLELVYASLGLAGLFWMPLAPLRRHGRWLVAIDVAMAVAGMALVMWVTTTLVDLSAAPSSERWRIIQYGLFTAGNLVALNMILVRGLARRVPGAIWFLAATVVLEIGYWVIIQLRLAGLLTDLRALDAVFGVDQVCYALAALSFLTAPVSGELEHSRAGRMLPINPLPAAAVVAVGGLLIRQVVTGATTGLLLITVVMVGLSLLLILRVILASHDRAQLIHAEAESARRFQADRAAAIRRLAGGLAHEFNNLMTVVTGNAELAIQTAPPDSALRSRLNRIHEAGTRAAALTSRLRTYSGDAAATLEPLELAGALLALRPRLLEIAGQGVDVQYALNPAAGDIVGDRDLVEQAVLHLAANARAAMPEGGTLRVTLRSETIETGSLPDAILPMGSGRYEVLEIGDTGIGIEAQKVPRIFDPFYSSQSLASAPGLGLATVHGIMTSHRGGIEVVSAPGEGTAIRLYFPSAPPTPGAALPASHSTRGR